MGGAAVMPRAKIGDLDLHYELCGQGPPLVMIMGLAGNADWWEPASVRLLGRTFRVIRFDNRDAGRTTGPATGYTIRDMAADTVGLMDHLGLEKAHILGISMGGMIAQELALNYPHRVDRLVLGCTTPGMRSGVPPATEVLNLMTQSQEGQPAWKVAATLGRVTLTPGWLLSHFWKLPLLAFRVGRSPARPEEYVRQLAAIGGFEAGDRLPGLARPTLILHGDRDILLPPENGRILSRLIPGARLIIYAGASHGFTTERPTLFARTVQDFLLTGTAV
jgi:3-oxoadipate enol-lactonase